MKRGLEFFLKENPTNLLPRGYPLEVGSYLQLPDLLDPMDSELGHFAQ